MARMMSTHVLMLILWGCTLSIVACHSSNVHGHLPLHSWGVMTTTTSKRKNPRQLSTKLLLSLRAGASVDVVNGEEDREGTGNDNDDNSNDKDNTSSSPSTTTTPSIISSEPIVVSLHTATGCRLLDVSLELNILPSRNVGFLKTLVAKSLGGTGGRKQRAPLDTLIQLRHQGQLLQDDHVLIEELLHDMEEDDDDDEDERKSGSKQLTFTLDMIPPVEPKFAVNQLQRHQVEQMTTLELLEAYTTNAAAMYLSGQAILRESGGNDGGDDEEQHDKTDIHTNHLGLSVQLQERARLLRQDLEDTFPDKVKEMLLQEQQHQQKEVDATAHHNPATAAALGVVQRRGQRYRVAGGAKTNLKRMIQRNLNVDWGGTIRNVCLFLFFGFFGGRNAWSKYLLLLGAPMSVLLQARPAKYMLKRLFYTMVYPPAILLSLLPAPQQAILNYQAHEAYQAIYPTMATAMKKMAMKEAAAAAVALANEEEDEEEEGDEEEEEDDDEEEE